MCLVGTCGQPKQEIGSDLCGARHFWIKRGDRSDGIPEMVSHLQRGQLARLAQRVRHALLGPLVLLARPDPLDQQHPQADGRR